MLGLPGNRVLPENYDKAKKDYEISQDQIFIQRIAIFLLRREKRTTFVHVRDRVVDSACLNRCLPEFAARTLRRFVFKILRMYGF